MLNFELWITFIKNKFENQVHCDYIFWSLL